MAVCVLLAVEVSSLVLPLAVAVFVLERDEVDWLPLVDVESESKKVPTVLEAEEPAVAEEYALDVAVEVLAWLYAPVVEFCSLDQVLVLEADEVPVEVCRELRTSLPPTWYVADWLLVLRLVAVSLLVSVPHWL